MLAVVEVEVTDVELHRGRAIAPAGGGLLTGRFDLRDRNAHRRAPFPPCMPATTTRASTLKSRIVSVMISAPDHASFCQSLYGLSANWKITTGRFAIGAFKLVLQNWLFSAVKSS